MLLPRPLMRIAVRRRVMRRASRPAGRCGPRAGRRRSRPIGKAVSPSAASSEVAARRVAHHQRHADAAVEHPKHLLRRDPALPGEPPEHRRHRPVGPQRRPEPVRQDPRQVARQSAAGDVRRRLEQTGAMQRQQRADIDPRRRQQRLAQDRMGVERRRVAPAQPRIRRPPDGPARIRWNAPPNSPAPAPRRPRRRRAAAAGRARRRPRRSRRGRSRLPAYIPGISAVSPPTRAQPACRQPSAMPPITSRAVRHRQPAGGVVVEEEQGLGALHHQVVDAHRDEVDADRVVPADLDGELQLGADAVGGGDQDRVGEAGGLQVEQRAEAADAADRAGPRWWPRRAA